MGTRSDTEACNSMVEDLPAFAEPEGSDAEEYARYTRVWEQWDKLLGDGKLRQIDKMRLAALLQTVYSRGAAAGRSGE